MIEKVLVFDIWGDYAHFRKIETTTSPLTYSIPTGTSLLGLVSAIVGLERDSYYDLFSPENTKYAIRILNPIKKVEINLSLIDTKKGLYLWDIKKNPRTLIPFEFLKEPKYRIYFWTSHLEIYKKLKGFLEKHQSFYTPYLGISELIANFKFVGELDDIEKCHGQGEIHTVIRKDKARLMIETGKRYGLERIPLFMDSNRVVREYADVILELNGKPLKVSDSEFYRIGSENVIFI